MQLFRKLLQDSDLSETLSFPTESLKAFNLPDGADPSMEFEAEDAMGHPWQFQLTIQPHGPDRLHPEPTLSSGWFHFVSQKGLRAGDEVAFYKKEDGSRGPPFKIEVQKVNTFSNPDIQPTVQYIENGKDPNGKQGVASDIQSSEPEPDDRTVTSAVITTSSGKMQSSDSKLPNLRFRQQARRKVHCDFFYQNRKKFKQNKEVRKKCKVLSRKKDALLLLLSYPMVMMDKDQSEKWIAESQKIMRDVKSNEENLFGEEAEEWQKRLQGLSARVQKQLDVPLTDDVEGVLPGDIVEKLFMSAEANIGPQLELDRNRNLVSGETSESTVSSTHCEREVTGEQDKTQLMASTSYADQVEEVELIAHEALPVPEEVFDVAVDFAVRQTLDCIKRGDINRIRITGRNEQRVIEAIKHHQDVAPEFRYILGFTLPEHQSSAEVHEVIDRQLDLRLSRCSGSINLAPEFKLSDNLQSLGIFLLLEDSYKKMNFDNLSLPLQINLNDLDNHLHPSVMIFNSKMAADLEIRMEDHLLPWEVFCRNAGEVLLSPTIRQIAARIVKECRGNLQAILLMARSLKTVTDDVSLWELAVQKLSRQPTSEVEDIDYVMVNALTFIWERMNNKTRHCIKLCTWYPLGEKIDRASLICHWIQDCLVDTYDEGNDILQSLVDAFLVDNLPELDCIQLRREIYDVLVKVLIPRMSPVFLMLGSLRLTEPPKDEEWDAKEIHLMDNELSELPESPKCPSLIALYLQKNLDLMAVPSSFFKHMPNLQILDLSHTSLKSLPESLSSLVTLRELILKGCELLMELPRYVGELRNLEKLDLDKTEIIDLPAEVGNLSKLKFLRVSFYGFMNCSKTKLCRDTIIHPGTISKLSELTELNIDVNPDDERWNATVQAVVEEACSLKALRQLNLHLPNIQILQKRRAGSTSLVHYPLPRFRFTVGYHKQQVISRVPEEAEAHFKNGEKCLKFVKGRDIPAEMKMALNHSTAFFLDGHATARSLSDFGLENIKQLKCCLLADCHEIQTIIDCEEAHEEHDSLEKLQYLNVYCMKNLQSIWRRPVRKNCLASLKFLAVHACPKLTTLFLPDLLANLVLLEELIVEKCPQLTSLVNLTDHSFSNPATDCFLPSLKKISLLYLPELVSISSGLCIASELESVGIYNCPKLESLSTVEISSENLRVIKGESKWWEALKWKESEWGNRLDYLNGIFSPIIRENDIKTQLAAEGLVELSFNQ
ncbi:PREDICTED: probable disease resistance protein At4g27220 [Theobroma cacao]|uniref:Probable disease resistance protein At4g27220 n=1 Tax=Theobroma cacao TaxID=3641 RepID=A0AB32VW37_THECC|nr:PREDICTED: probable disease resistance protein At4g27220 [Theobroma cacao]